MSVCRAMKRSLEDSYTATIDSTEALASSSSFLPSPDSQRDSRRSGPPQPKRIRTEFSNPAASFLNTTDVLEYLVDVPDSPLSSAASDISDWPEAIEEKRVKSLDIGPPRLPTPKVHTQPRTPRTPRPLKKPQAPKTPRNYKQRQPPKQARTPRQLPTPTSELRRSGRASALTASSAITSLYESNPDAHLAAGWPVTPVEASLTDSEASLPLSADAYSDIGFPVSLDISFIDTSTTLSEPPLAIAATSPLYQTSMESVGAERLISQLVEVARPPTDAFLPPISLSQSPSSDLDANPQTIVSQSKEEPSSQSPNDTLEYSLDGGKELYLWDIANQISDARPGPGSRPSSSQQPQVWAEGRQALCETLPYYRAYQSGGYCTDGLARAFMFDSNSHSRDYMDQNVVISRAGGGKSKDETSGEMIMNGDQKESTQVSDVRNNMAQCNPVVIIVGEKNPTCPSQPPHTYCVMDWFKPTHVWFEKTKGHKMIRYRFEKLRPYENCWWVPTDWREPIGLGDLEPPVSTQCDTCNEKSLRVYMNGWMCLNPTCLKFWKHADGSEPEEEQLLYDPRFLTAKTPWPQCSEPSPIRPELLTVSSLPIQGQDMSMEAWKGFVCPKCGRCNSREVWEGWECGGLRCGFTYKLKHTLVPEVALRDPYFPLGAGYAFSRDLVKENNVRLRVEYAHNYRINYFDIPGIEGFVAHLIANKTINEESGGPNDMFEDLQLNSIGLRRSKLPSGMLKGQSLTQHFLVNYGMPYKFVVAAKSHPFNTAASPITNTRSRLNWAGRLVAPDMPHEFNEVLALGYFEKQSISYHDDGEHGLGPTIATLSLGCTAEMKLRMKANHYHGVTKGKNYIETTPIPGCKNYEIRKAAHDILMGLKATDPVAYKAKLKALPKELGLTSTGHARDALVMKLGHGDIVVMHGTGIQQYYEHAVEPKGKLRFALTCRYIDPESLKPEDRPSYDVLRDGRAYDGSLLPAAQ